MTAHNGPVKSRHVRFMTTPDMDAAIDRAARYYEMSRSEVIRWYIVKGLEEGGFDVAHEHAR